MDDHVGWMVWLYFGAIIAGCLLVLAGHVGPNQRLTILGMCVLIVALVGLYIGVRRQGV